MHISKIPLKIQLTESQDTQNCRQDIRNGNWGTGVQFLPVSLTHSDVEHITSASMCV